MSREAYSPPNPSGWLTSNIKLIFFPTTPQQREKREWWKEITGKEPDESVRKKEEAAEAGLLPSGHRLTVSVSLPKLEIEVEPVRVPTEPDSECLATLGPLAAQTEEFFGLVLPWLRLAPPIKRIGFAASLAFPTAAQDENYRLLDRMLQTVDVDPESSDFLYRVNRKTKSKAEPAGMLLNQLMVWTSQRLARQVFAMTGERIETHEVGPGLYFAALTLDVNTDQSRTEAFDAGTLERLCRELAGLAIQIVTRGDTR